MCRPISKPPQVVSGLGAQGLSPPVKLTCGPFPSALDVPHSDLPFDQSHLKLKLKGLNAPGNELISPDAGLQQEFT